ncbi:MAG: hypothetical protein QOH57_588 [Mycobacterium sp.]|jgi:hypothetical protein|nr:hypothetical protein [Mycobacterium sp.]
MTRLHPGWLVVLFATMIAISGWLPWRETTADGGGHSSAMGGTVGSIVPLSKFDAGQLIVLLASGLIVAGAMTARNLSVRVSAIAALVLSLSIGGLTIVYYLQKVHPPVDAAFGLYICAVATVLAVLCSAWGLLAGWAQTRVPK